MSSSHSSTGEDSAPLSRPWSRLAIGFGGSLMLHGAVAALLLSGALRAPASVLSNGEERLVTLEVVETPSEPEPPEPSPRPPEPAKEPPAPVKEPEPPRPPPVKPPPAEEPRPERAKEVSPSPLPPSSDPDGEAADAGDEPIPLNVGISMRSTVGDDGGGMRVGVGSTLYGRPDRVASDPSEARSYRGGEVPRGDRVEPPAPAFVSPHQVTTMPRVRREVRAPYPEEARQHEIEGRVVLRLEIDEHGRVTKAVPIEGPGHGLEEAAADALRRFVFYPAEVDGRKVATEIRYVYTFLLD